MTIQLPSEKIILSLSKKKGDFIVKASKSSGPGGQNVNKRNTKINIIHTNSGAQATCQTYRTQEMNRKEAFRRLLETPIFKTWLRVELARRGVETNLQRQETPNDERIRTYHFLRDEVEDHRSGLKIKGVKKVLNGEIDLLIESVQKIEV